MNNLTVIENNGILVVDSREAAKVLEVRHSDLLRDIEKYIGALENSENAKLRSQEFFIESTYTTGGNNKEYKNRLLTKNGCEVVAHKRTGKDGVIFTAFYIEQFHLKLLFYILIYIFYLLTFYSKKFLLLLHLLQISLFLIKKQYS